jgi:hypothetical protein
MNTMKFFALAALSAFNTYATACCCVAPPGQPALIGNQNNIIVWNEDTKTEHFIRNASFDSAAKDIGFIAPSPNTPELAEVNPEAYRLLGEMKPVPPPDSEKAAVASLSESIPSTGIQVLQVVDVGRYEATSLKASDSGALASYLKTNGYTMTSGIQKWTEHYIQKNWVLTAFKVKDKNQKTLRMEAIRMSFKADKPFNPYYVPAENASKVGLLTLYFVSEGNYKPTVGNDEKGSWKEPKWTSDRSLGVTTKQLADHLKLEERAIPKNATVTYYESSFPDPDRDDLFFTRQSSTNPVSMGIPIAIFAALIAAQSQRRRKATALAN